MHYYKFNIADYRKDTSHLSTLEHGIYRQLIDWYYLDEKPIPLETESVMRRLRLASEDINSLKNVLSDFFECRATGYHQPRCDMEINDYHHNSAINKENGKLGGRPKKTERVISANRMESESKGNHKPLTTNHKPLTKKPIEIQAPEGVSDQVWQDFVKSRKTLRAAITQSAIDGIQREADKAGWMLEDALRECCARGWRGFKADWVADKAKPQQAKQPKSFAQMDREASWARWEEMTNQVHPDRIKAQQGNLIDVTPSFLEIEQ